MKSFHKVISAFSMAAILASANAAEIKIGVIMPITGAVAAYGQTAWAGIEIANKISPTLKNGDTIKLVLIDNKGDKVETANAATRLITEDKVSALIGAMVTANTQQVLQIAEEKRVPVVAPAATADKLLDRAKFGARVTFMDSFQGTTFAKFAIKNELKSAVIVTDQSTSYSLGLARAFKKEFEKSGGKVLNELKISSGDKDFKAIVSQIASLNPAIVYVPVYHPEASLLVRQARQIGVKAVFGSGDGVSNDTFLQLAGDASNGYLYTDVFDSANPPTQVSKDFIAEYSKSKKGADIPGFTALGADSYLLLLDAMNRCDNPSDPICINQKIKNTQKFEGVSGYINIDKKGNAVRSVVIKEIKNGKVTYKDTVNP
ncbi:high-affinity branched-chain amino acid ABC transporter, periplasmic Leu/Ile/Val-binding protein [Candidatus Campylobacter infans]|uniref:High-affinity branched-chain amino acid ABC transporter, periplasmic Leu/Ile/Val-binding protein n=1 Tax=Candidatus Campylobacter infans TaxID=2561898 RepID=A0A7H9CJW6_9BACT|nr:ABC transporter substrate-binding protein [Candidatus Campylobacter infans]QLI05921.1 high-affinity branched-chain amino acid ABC transporter, periplasmic Leu/Ile/Val-binding protein [Candidatus Campylobacter infans]